ncbi:hypothetical protein GCM10027610_068010 [Dactylosporangium cerinum]
MHGGGDDPEDQAVLVGDGESGVGPDPVDGDQFRAGEPGVGGGVPRDERQPGDDDLAAQRRRQRDLEAGTPAGDAEHDLAVGGDQRHDRHRHPGRAGDQVGEALHGRLPTGQVDTGTADRRKPPPCRQLPVPVPPLISSRSACLLFVVS